MKYYLKKILGLAVTLFLVSFITFLVFSLLPENPAEIILGVNAEPEEIAAMEKELGLDRPYFERYISWIGNLMKGNLGTSYRYHQSVSELIKNSFGVTLGLSVISLILTVAIGLPMGIYISKKHNKFLNALLSFATQIGYSVPYFCTAILLIYFFTVKNSIFPSMGYVPFSQNPLGYFKTMILPSLAIAIGSSAILMRYIKVCIEDEKVMDYVRTAKSKGIGNGKILRKHILRNSLIPSITMLGMLVADILGGSIIIENVFSLPGIGKLIAVSISTRDLPLIQGLVLYLAVIVALCSFAVDMIYSVIDPRIRIK